MGNWQVKFTPKFFERDSLKAALEIGSEQFAEFSPERLKDAYIWLMIERAKTAKISRHATNLANAVMVNEKTAGCKEFTALSLAGMVEVEISEKDRLEGTFRPSPEAFQAWLKSYPQRTANGIKPTRGDTNKAKVAFYKVVTSQRVLTLLEQSAVNYGERCGEYAMDAHRFLTSGSWKGYTN